MTSSAVEGGQGTPGADRCCEQPNDCPKGRDPIGISWWGGCWCYRNQPLGVAASGKEEVAFVIAKGPSARAVHILADYEEGRDLERQNYIGVRCGVLAKAIPVARPVFPGFKPCGVCFRLRSFQPLDVRIKEKLRGQVSWFTSENYTRIAMRRWLAANPGFFDLPPLAVPQ